MGGREESEDLIAGGKGLFINTNKQNKQKQPRRGKTDWQGRTRLDKARLDKAGQDRTQDIQHTTTNQHRNCKHKEILKGANEEGKEGRQVGQINQ